MEQQTTQAIFAKEGVTKSDRVLHTPGSFAKKCLLYVQEAGTLKSLTPHVCRRNHLDSFLIFEVLAGRGTICYEGQTYELLQGQYIWIDCRKEFAHESDGKDPWKLSWIHFNGSCAGDFYELFLKQHHAPVFVPADASATHGMLQKIPDLIRENVSELEVHGMLTQLIVSCLRTVREKDLIREIREYMNANYKESGWMELLKQRFDIPVRELEEMFMDSCGIGLSDYMLSRRFHAAKEQLRFTILPVEDIIRESGIGKEDLFYRLFQEHENMSPQEYRKKWAQWMKD